MIYWSHCFRWRCCCSTLGSVALPATEPGSLAVPIGSRVLCRQAVLSPGALQPSVTSALECSGSRAPEGLLEAVPAQWFPLASSPCGLPPCCRDEVCPYVPSWESCQIGLLLVLRSWPCQWALYVPLQGTALCVKRQMPHLLVFGGMGQSSLRWYIPSLCSVCRSWGLSVLLAACLV